MNYNKKLFIQPFLTGFTILEILIVLGIVSILISLSASPGLDFYRSQQIESKSREIVQNLRRSQMKAMSSESDSSFGIYFTTNSYTLFKGDNYALRQSGFDEVFEIPSIITLSGLSEIVFSKLEGEPNVTGDIILTSNSQTRTININELGRINLQ